MFGMSGKVDDQSARVKRAAETATFRTIRSAAFAIGRYAKGLIVKSKSPSLPGESPTTRGRGGKNLRGAIFTDSSKDSAIIGPRFSMVGDVGQAHEFGKTRKGDDFEKRPFMRPALEANLNRFASDWQGEIGE